MLSQSIQLSGLGLIAVVALVAAAPCDIYANGKTPCIAAHSTTRALYGSYPGPLYQVRRRSDNTPKDIMALSQGGIADAASQDTFCAGTTCVISIIYDQSGKSNDLTRAPNGTAGAGPAPGGFDNLAIANAAPVKLNGHKVYGVAIVPEVGYRNNKAVGTAMGDGAQGIYAVLDGTDFDDACCFDYGNAERNSSDNGAGAMEALNFSNKTKNSRGAGKGPWIMADLEMGLYAGQNKSENPMNPSINYRFVTAILKGEPNHWALRGGDASNGSLSTFFNGPRPAGYTKMDLEGGIILGIGGDNSRGGRGTFYEGIITSSYPSDATENSVQANIVAAKYST